MLLTHSSQFKLTYCGL